MGSNTENIELSNGKGGVIPTAVVTALKAQLPCEIVVKGEAENDVYKRAIHRYNEAGIQEAVR